MALLRAIVKQASGWPQMSCEMIGELRSIVEQASHKARIELNDDRYVTSFSETSDPLATDEL